MPYYRVVGDVPRKRHVQFRRPDGGLYAEELMGEEGFSSRLLAALPPLLTHGDHQGRGRHAAEPTTLDAEPAALPPPLPHPGPADRRATWSPDGGCWPAIPTSGSSYAATEIPSELYRDSMGDECVYIADGRAGSSRPTARSRSAPGDYVVIPTGTIHRWVPQGRVDRPDHRGGGPHPAAQALPVPVRPVPGARAVLRARPARTRPSRCIVEGEEVPVLVRTRGGLTRLTYANHPFDVVGWDGCLYPYAFNIDDFEPIVKTHPRAAAGAPDLRGPGLRDLLVLPAAAGLPPGRRYRSPTTTTTSTPTSSCSTSGGDRAYATAGIIAIFIIPPLVIAVAQEVARGGFAQYVVLLGPAQVLDGVNAFLFGRTPSDEMVQFARLPGPVYVGAALIMAAAAVAVLLRRYQKIEA